MRNQMIISSSLRKIASDISNIKNKLQLTMMMILLMSLNYLYPFFTLYHCPHNRLETIRAVANHLMAIRGLCTTLIHIKINWGVFFLKHQCPDSTSRDFD